MPITIIKDNLRFNLRAGAIIYNETNTKILLENQKNQRYIFPGGRIEIFEDSKETLKRELQEELNITAKITLKYILELMTETKERKYHEVGFYYVTHIREADVPNHTKSLDDSGIFEWIDIDKLNDYNIIAKPIKDKIINNQIEKDTAAHIIYHN